MMPKPPRPKPISLWRKENKRVTICAGFKSNFGVVLCADSQETVGVMKFDAPKLIVLPSHGEPDDQVRMAFAGAGDGPFIDKLVEKMWEAAQRGPGMTHQQVLERVEDANLEWHKKIWEVYGREDRPEAHILISLYTPNEVSLYKATGPIITEVDSHAFVGIGGELGNFLAQHLRSGCDSLQEDVGISLYILDNAKKFVDGCGGDTQIAAMMIDGSIQQMQGWQTHKLSDGLFAIGREIYALFALAASRETTKKEIDDAARGIVKYIHRHRAQMRKDVKKTIRVSPALQKALQIFYRKIEWPPTKTKPSTSHTSEDQP
jgi:hypothetical protein